MPRFRKKPVEVDAVQWTGTNAQEVNLFARGGAGFDVLSDEDRGNCNDPQATAMVYDVLHSTWVLVRDGDWLIKGVKGEFYPCRDSVFRETYEAVDA